MAAGEDRATEANQRTRGREEESPLRDPGHQGRVAPYPRAHGEAGMKFGARGCRFSRGNVTTGAEIPSAVVSLDVVKAGFAADLILLRYHSADPLVSRGRGPLVDR